ncbi:MAG: hypothetical protein UZ19_OD1000909 [Parcubacteria bacterium OLB19]|nr:MAG: hypothetical protein UZ19_OD1000909 [Parcubacteria bacterium OLB19]
MYVKVRVIPKAKKETVSKIDDQIFEMTVKEPAERNLANNRIKELLAKEYGVKIESVRIISGHHSGSKMFDVKVEI